MPNRRHDLHFARFCRTGDSQALGLVFDDVAPELHGLARYLGASADLADDLVQATFLIAIEKRASFHAGDPVMPWLVTILQNRARNARRAQLRKLDPDRVPLTLVAPDPVTAAERTELSVSIERALARLDEPYGSLLNLHLRHGLDASEIAAHVDRSPAAVRRQLAQGLDRLRAVLPASLAGAVTVAAAGSLRSMAPVRVAVVEAARNASPAGAASLLSASGLALKLGTAIAATVVAVAATTLLATWQDGVAEHALPPAEVASLAPGLVPVGERPGGEPLAGQPGEDASAASVERRPVETPADGPFDLAVRVVDARSGTVVPDYRLRIERAPIGDVREPQAATTTAAATPGVMVVASGEPAVGPIVPEQHHPSGRYATNALASGRYMVQARAADPDLLPSDLQLVDVREGAATTVEIRLAAAACRTLRVIGPDGEPVAGTEVELLAPRAVTRPTLATDAVEMLSNPNERPAAMLVQHGRTGDDGTCTLRGPHESLALRLRGPTHAPAVIQAVTLDVDAPLEVHVGAGATIDGVVAPVAVLSALSADGDGRPTWPGSGSAPEIRLVDAETHEVLPLDAPVRVGVDGAFRIDHAPPGTFDVQLSSSLKRPGITKGIGVATWSTIANVSLTDEAYRTVRADVAARMPGTCSGRITVDGGTVAAGSTLWFLPLRGADPDERPALPARIRTDGTFEARLLPGAWSAQVSIPNPASEEFPVVRLCGPVVRLAPGATATQELAFRSATVTIRVTDARGVAVPAGRIQVEGEAVGWLGWLQADADGEIHPPRLPLDVLTVWPANAGEVAVNTTIGAMAAKPEPGPLGRIDLRGGDRPDVVEVRLGSGRQ